MEAVDAIIARTGLVLPLVVLFLVYLVVKYPNRLAGTHGDRPGVHTFPGLPIIGNTIAIVRRGTRDQFHRLMEQLELSTSPVYSWTFWPTGRLFMISRPEYIEYVQKTNFENYTKGAYFRDAFADLLGETGIFVADGHPWKTQRKMASHIFSVNQFRNIVQKVVHDELRALSTLLGTVADSDDGHVALPDLFFRYTLSSFAKIAFSADIGCLSEDPAVLDHQVPFSVAFDNAQEHINKRLISPGWQVIEKFSKGGADMRRWVQDIRGFAMKIIDDRLAEGKKSKRDSGSGLPDFAKNKDLLALAMELTKEREDLLIVVLNFLIAGRDTTAQSLSWLFIELMAHPEHISIIRDEIRCNLEAAADDEPVLLDYDRMKDLPYTTACISEAIRLHPSVAKNVKMVERDDVIVPQGPNPHNLPSFKVYRGEKVAWSDWVMARTPEVWGDDCAEFKPSRFLRDGDDEKPGARYQSPSEWQFHAFNGGPRRCLGQQLAMYEALALVVAVVPHFDVSWLQGQKTQWPPTYTSSVTHPSQPYEVRVQRSTGASPDATIA